MKNMELARKDFQRLCRWRLKRKAHVWKLMRTRTVKARAGQSRVIFSIKQISVSLKEQINYPQKKEKKTLN